MLCCESTTDERSAGNPHATFCGSRERATAPGDPVFSYSALTRMVRFAESMADERIVATLSQELSWSHFQVLLPIKNPLEREFYAEMCRLERWDIRTFRGKIGSMLFQRTALSKNTKAVITSQIAKLRDGRMTPELVFRDPYLLDFRGLKGAYSGGISKTPYSAR